MVPGYFRKFKQHRWKPEMVQRNAVVRRIEYTRKKKLNFLSEFFQSMREAINCLLGEPGATMQQILRTFGLVMQENWRAEQLYQFAGRTAAVFKLREQRIFAKAICDSSRIHIVE